MYRPYPPSQTFFLLESSRDFNARGNPRLPRCERFCVPSPRYRTSFLALVLFFSSSSPLSSFRTCSLLTFSLFFAPSQRQMLLTAPSWWDPSVGCLFSFFAASRLREEGLNSHARGPFQHVDQPWIERLVRSFDALCPRYLLRHPGVCGCLRRQLLRRALCCLSSRWLGRECRCLSAAKLLGIIGGLPFALPCLLSLFAAGSSRRIYDLRSDVAINASAFYYLPINHDTSTSR